MFKVCLHPLCLPGYFATRILTKKNPLNVHRNTRTDVDPHRHTEDGELLQCNKRLKFHRNHQMITWCLRRLQNLAQNLDAWGNGLELVLRGRPKWRPLVFSMTEFKPEPTQNITVGSKKAQLGQSAMRSDNNGLHHSVPLRKKTKRKLGWDDSWVT